MKHVGEALQDVHNEGFLHNNLKVSYVVLEDKSRHFNAMIIDFRKSTRFDVPMKKSMAKDEQKIYQ